MPGSGTGKVELRRAVKSDCDLLFEFVNRADSLAAKLMTSHAIRRDQHDAWFAGRLRDEACRIWILMVDGAAQGQIRFLRSRDGWEIDVYIDAAARRGGIASAAMQQAITELRGEQPHAVMVAHVKTGNLASEGLFESLGFCKAEETSSHLTYVLAPK